MFRQGAFQIDPNLTPEEVSQRRERILDMMNQAPARYAGEGLARFAQRTVGGIGASRLNDVERANRQAATDQFNAVMGGPLTVLGMQPDFGGAPVPPVTTRSMDPNDPENIAADAMAAIGRDPASKIRQGLIQRGLPEHIADAFIMNFQDESGLRTDINEIAPIVPGSRGGFGLAQWTGPRRRALEAFAQERGVPVSDLDVQLDFLMTELQGPEAAAARRIFAAGDTGSAAEAIVRDFLRPLPQHQESRAARYTGGQQPQQDPMIGQLTEALNNPWLTIQQRQTVQQMLDERRQAADPLRQLQIQQAQMQIEQMRNPAPPEGVVVGGRIVNPATGQIIYEPGPGAQPVGEYGLQPIYGRDAEDNVVVMQLGKDGTAVATRLPEGVRPDLAVAAEERAAGTGRGQSQAEREAAAPGVIRQAEQTMGLIDAVLSDPALPGITGALQGRIDPESMFSPLLGQQGVDLAIRVEQLKGRAFLEAFETLKGGGQITEREGQAAQAAIARLQRVQSETAFRAALLELRQISDNARRRAMGEDVPEYVPSAPAPTHRYNPETGQVEPAQ